MTTLKRITLVLALLTLTACANFSKHFTPLEKPQVVKQSFGAIQVTIPQGWRHMDYSGDSVVVMTTSGYPLNQILVEYERFKKHCLLTNKNAKRASMIELQANYETCLKKRNDYTVKETQIKPYRHQGLEGIHAVNVLLPKDGGVPTILDEYIVIDNKKKKLARLRFFAELRMHYKKHKGDFEAVRESLRLKSGT